MSVLAFDLGAGSGRAIIGRLDDRRLSLTEIHRFSNDPVQVAGRLHWDILRLYYEIKQGILQANQQKEEVESLGIDSWAVDFGLLDQRGELLGNPYHYRDAHTNGIMEEVFGIVSKKEIFERTGIQFLTFNTIYQLYAMKKNGSRLLEHADSLLMIPDLLRYFLSGEKKSEFTNASTTQFYNPLKQDWDRELLQKLGLPAHILSPVMQPGTVVGSLQKSVCNELGVPSYPVIAVGEHDTGAAVAAVPSMEDDFAYLSCGTWSLMGTEVSSPVMNEQALALNFTNEGGVFGTYRLLKNIMGLWLLERCIAEWEKAGVTYEYPQLLELANEAKPFRSVVDPDHDTFLNPSNMPEAIRDFCRKTEQPVPDSIGEIVRCVLESLALKYRYVLERTEQLSDKKFSGLHMVGGGIQNRMLCQFTANALGRPVWAGPTEGSSIGNIIMQLITLGQIKSIKEARQIVRDSFQVMTYEPEEATVWNEQYEKFCEYVYT